MNHSHKNIPRSHNPSVHRKPQIDSFLPPEDYPNLCKHENLDQAFGVYGNLQLSLHGTSVLQLFVEEKPKPEPKPKNWVRVQVHFFWFLKTLALPPRPWPISWRILRSLVQTESMVKLIVAMVSPQPFVFQTAQIILYQTKSIFSQLSKWWQFTCTTIRRRKKMSFVTLSCVRLKSHFGLWFHIRSPCCKPKTCMFFQVINSICNCFSIFLFKTVIDYVRDFTLRPNLPKLSHEKE